MDPVISRRRFSNVFNFFFFYFLATSNMSSWKKACHFIGTNLNSPQARMLCMPSRSGEEEVYNDDVDDDDDDIWQKAHTRRKWLNSITMQRTSSKYTYTSLKLGWQLSDFQSFHLSSDLFPVRFVSLNPISKANFVAEEVNVIFVSSWQKTIYNMRTWIIICC